MDQLIAHPLQLRQPLPLSQHPVAVYLNQLSPSSAFIMKRNLNRIAHFLSEGHCDADTLDWSKLTYQHTSALRAGLLAVYAPATVNQILCALRRVLNEAKLLRLITPSDCANAVAVKSVKEKTTMKGRALTASEIQALMQVCLSAESIIGSRDAALLAILFGGGLRRSEAIALDLSDYTPSQGQLLIRDGKGGKSRTVYLAKNSQALLENWLNLRGRQPGPLLLPVSKGEKIQWRRMTSQAVLYLLQKLAYQAGIASFSPHDCRRTYISELLEAGVDIITVQFLAGHASAETTAKYDRRGEQAKQKASQALDFPF